MCHCSVFLIWNSFLCFLTIKKRSSVTPRNGALLNLGWWVILTTFLIQLWTSYHIKSSVLMKLPIVYHVSIVMRTKLHYIPIHFKIKSEQRFLRAYKLNTLLFHYNTFQYPSGLTFTNLHHLIYRCNKIHFYVSPLFTLFVMFFFYKTPKLSGGNPIKVFMER